METKIKTEDLSMECRVGAWTLLQLMSGLATLGLVATLVLRYLASW